MQSTFGKKDTGLTNLTHLKKHKESHIITIFVPEQRTLCSLGLKMVLTFLCVFSNVVKVFMRYEL